MSQILVYCIVKPGIVNTYVGYTVDWDRRIRQHNNDLAGGARYTTALINKGTGPWRPLFHVTGFKTQRHAKQLEWLLHSTHEPGSRRRKSSESTHAWRLRRLASAFAPTKLRFTKSAPLTADSGLTVVYF